MKRRNKKWRQWLQSASFIYDVSIKILHSIHDPLISAVARWLIHQTCFPRHRKVKCKCKQIKCILETGEARARTHGPQRSRQTRFRHILDGSNFSRLGYPPSSLPSGICPKINSFMIYRQAARGAVLHLQTAKYTIIRCSRPI